MREEISRNIICKSEIFSSIQPLIHTWKINLTVYRVEVNSYKVNFIVKLIAKLIFIERT